MAGLSFIHFGFLAAGLAIVVPIAIHLLFRQKARTVSIGSIRFLQQVVREHRRRRRLRQWILLLLRTAAVALLALLFARPFFNAAFRNALHQELIVLLDGSASMQARDASGGTSWTRAVSRVQETLAATDENVIIHVAVCDATGVRELPLDRWQNDARPGDAATDFGLALAWARDVLAASRRPRQRVILVSDLQRSGLPQVVADVLPKSVEFLTHDVGASFAPNLAITGVEAIRTEIRPADPIVLRATVRNFGPLAARKISLRMDLDGPGGPATVNRELDVSGRGTARIDFPCEISTDGLYRGSVTLATDDTLLVDNSRWFAFEARRPDRILLVDGQEGRSVFANETYFLETALKLRPLENSPSQRSFETERIVWEAGEGFPRLDGYRALVLANVRRLTPSDATRLRDYLDSGGSVLLFAGDQVTRASLQPLADAGINVGDVPAAPRAERLRVTGWAADHPVFLPLADPQRGDVRRLEFHHSLPLESPAPNARPLLESGPHVLAAEVGVGRGRFVYVGTSADRDWTEWPRTRLYVPLVRQLLAYLTDQLAERSRITTRVVERFDDPLGVHDVAERVVVTNLDPRESSLDRIEPESFRESLGLAPWAPGEQAESAGLNIEPPANALRADEIWTSLAWILLAVLAAETLLASRVHA